MIAGRIHQRPERRVAELGGERFVDARGRVDPRHVDESGAFVEVALAGGHRGVGQRRLPNAAGAHQGDQATVAQSVGHQLQLSLPPDQRHGDSVGTGITP
ncbi:MAG: hypothetical protein ACRD29_18710 [Acidimicrobiales bacterium]